MTHKWTTNKSHRKCDNCGACQERRRRATNYQWWPLSGSCAKSSAECKTCGGSFKRLRRSQVYCSNKCKGRAHPHLVVRTCAECGETKEFFSGSKKFCSWECYLRSRVLTYSSTAERRNSWNRKNQDKVRRSKRDDARRHRARVNACSRRHRLLHPERYKRYRSVENQISTILNELTRMEEQLGVSSQETLR